MKRFALVLIVLSLLAVRSVFAQDIRPSYLLVEQAGEILIVEVQTQHEINLTDNLDELAVWPFWSQGSTLDEYVSFIIVDELPSNREVPMGIAAWVEVGNDEINTISHCEMGDVLCTDAQISGEWLIFTAIRTSDGFPTLYLHNLESGEQEILQSGDFEPGHYANHWREADQFQIVGSFSDSFANEIKIFNIPGPDYKVQEAWDLDFHGGFVGCNGETENLVGNSARHWMEVRADDNETLLEMEETRIAKGENPWRSCRAGEIKE